MGRFFRLQGLWSPLWRLQISASQQGSLALNQTVVLRAGFPVGSLFFGTELPVHVKATWGGFDLVDATKELLRAALTDERNKKLMLVSESCIPLYPPTLIYQQLMSEPKSRINACPHRVRSPHPD